MVFRNKKDPTKDVPMAKRSRYDPLVQETSKAESILCIFPKYLLGGMESPRPTDIAYCQ